MADRGGTIETGGAAQELLPARPARRWIAVQNQSDGDLYIDEEVTAVVGQPSIRIEAGALYETMASMQPTGRWTIIGATTGQAYAVRWG